MSVKQMTKQELQREVIEHRLHQVPPKAIRILNEFEGRIIPTNVAHKLEIRKQNTSELLKRLKKIEAIEEVEPNIDDKRVRQYKIKEDFKQVADEVFTS